MKLDMFGCLVMEKDGMPGDLGDSCAETGRLVVLTNDGNYRAAPGGGGFSVDLNSFLTPLGFVRHPQAPDGWREADFTSDQGNYLLMATWLTNRALYNVCVGKIKLTHWFWARGGHLLTLDSVALTNQWWNALGVTTVAQILINALPLRWSDDTSRTGFWKYWRFTSSNDSTVSYMTVYITMVFLQRVGVTWPQRFWNEAAYLAKAKAYYASQPNSTWFTDLYSTAPLIKTGAQT